MKNQKNKNRKLSFAICLVLFAILLLLPQAKALADTTSQISQFGITWTFDRDYEYGQFANGDYWVVGPVIIIGITPASTVTDGRTINGSMLDPNSGQGFDSASGGYNASLNVARPNGNDLSASNPLVIAPNHSLVSAISTPSPARPILTDGAVLTVLASAANANSFRPPYARSDKTIRYNVSGINFDILKSLASVTGTPSLATAERWFERPWFDWVYTDQYIKPSNNMPNYGRDMAVQTGDGALILNLNYTNAQKKTLMIRYIQLGIDLYGIIQAGNIHAWQNNGGFSHGRKLPILFAGMALDDSGMKGIGAKSGDYLYSGSYGAGHNPPDYIHFGEDDQTFYVTANDVYLQPYSLNTRHLGWGQGYNAGNVKVTHDSNIVEGVGTSWVGALYNLGPTEPIYFGVANDVEAYKTDGEGYLVKSIDSNTQLTLTEPYRGDSNQTGNATYILSDFVYYGHGDKYSSPHRDFKEFTNSHLDLPEWGIVYATEPSFGSDEWDAAYRPLCSYSYNGNALAALIMGMKSLWNHNAYFDYTDRWMTVGYIGMTRSLSSFAGNMWDAYRANYGPIWTMPSIPPPPSILYGDVSGDGEVSSYDAALTAQYSVGLITSLTQDQIKAADVSGNGEVSAYDAALIAQKAVGLSSKEPFINNLASVLSAIQNILGKLKSLF